LKRLKAKFSQGYTQRSSELSIEAWRTPEPLPFSKRKEGQKLKFKVGESWASSSSAPGSTSKALSRKSLSGSKVVSADRQNGELALSIPKAIPQEALTHHAEAFGCLGKRAVPVADPAKGGER